MEVPQSVAKVGRPNLGVRMIKITQLYQKSRQCSQLPKFLNDETDHKGEIYGKEKESISEMNLHMQIRC